MAVKQAARTRSFVVEQLHGLNGEVLNSGNMMNIERQLLIETLGAEIRIESERRPLPRIRELPGGQR